MIGPLLIACGAAAGLIAGFYWLWSKFVDYALRLRDQDAAELDRQAGGEWRDEK